MSSESKAWALEVRAGLAGGTLPTAWMRQYCEEIPGWLPPEVPLLFDTQEIGEEFRRLKPECQAIGIIRVSLDNPRMFVLVVGIHQGNLEMVLHFRDEDGKKFAWTFSNPPYRFSPN